MRKDQEKVMPESCFNRAKDHEMMFVLLGRDPVAPLVIRFWAMLRVFTGKNQPEDPQITEAYNCAERMDRERIQL